MSTDTYNPPSSSIALNALYDMAANVLRRQTDYYMSLMDGKRDIDKECGYPDVSELTAERYKEYYESENIAARVNDIFPDECWKVAPHVYEDEDNDSETAFEKAWKEMCDELRDIDVIFADKKKTHPLWKVCHRADRLCGIGFYGVMFLGVNDGLPLDQPAFGIDPGDSQEIDGTEAQYYDHSAVEYDDGVAAPQNNNDRRLLFVRALDETQAKIAEIENDVNNRRYGLPKYYNLTLEEQMMPQPAVKGQEITTQRVHWTRVVHIADGKMSSDVYGTPRQQQVFKRLIDCRKVYGGSGEGFWKHALPILSFESQSGLTPYNAEMSQSDLKQFREQIDLLMNSLQRYIITNGMKANQIAPAISDPSSHIKLHIEGICILLGIPMRIFMGSERGELASSQDKDTWDDRVQGRREGFCTTDIIMPLISHLVRLEILPKPEGEITVEWPPAAEISEEKRTAIMVQKVDALVKYISGGVDALIEPLDFLINIFGMEEEEAKQILENALEHLGDANPDADPETIVPGRNPTPPQLQGQDPNNPENPDEQDPENPDEQEQGAQKPKPPKPGQPPVKKGSMPPNSPKKKMPPGTTNKAKVKSKTGSKGIWRTTDDGQRIYIVPGKGVYAGGPGGPKLASADEVSTPKPSAIDKKIAKSKTTKKKVVKKTVPAPSQPAPTPTKPEKKTTKKPTPKKKVTEKSDKAAGSADWDKVSQQSQDMNSEWRANGNPKDLKMYSHAKKLSGKYTKEQAASLNEYSSSMYTEINAIVRSGAVSSAKPSMQDRINNIQAVTSQKLKEPVITYRGIDNKRAKALLKAGAMQAEGFVSTSLSKGLASAFAEPGSSNIHLLEIRAKTGASVESISRFPGEFEIVQAHGTKYRVVGSRKESVRGIMKSSNATIITLEEV